MQMYLGLCYHFNPYRTTTPHTGSSHVRIKTEKACIKRLIPCNLMEFMAGYLLCKYILDFSFVCSICACLQLYNCEVYNKVHVKIVAYLKHCVLSWIVDTIYFNSSTSPILTSFPLFMLILIYLPPF